MSPVFCSLSLSLSCALSLPLARTHAGCSWFLSCAVNTAITCLFRTRTAHWCSCVCARLHVTVLPIRTCVYVFPPIDNGWNSLEMAVFSKYVNESFGYIPRPPPTHRPLNPLQALLIAKCKYWFAMCAFRFSPTINNNKRSLYVVFASVWFRIKKTSSQVFALVMHCKKNASFIQELRITALYCQLWNFYNIYTSSLVL